MSKESVRTEEWVDRNIMRQRIEAYEKGEDKFTSLYILLLEIELLLKRAHLNPVGRENTAPLDGGIRHNVEPSDSAFLHPASRTEMPNNNCEGGVTSPAPSEQPVDDLKECVAEQLKEKSGYWYSCSGCHESGEYGSEQGYPFSDIFQCHLGSGCSECGGIGACWENTDYSDLTRTPSPSARTTASPTWDKEQWNHAVNEFADQAYSGLQWLKNIRDGISTAEEAIANMEAQFPHCQAEWQKARESATLPSAPLGGVVEPLSGDYWANIHGEYHKALRMECNCHTQDGDFPCPQCDQITKAMRMTQDVVKRCTRAEYKVQALSTSPDEQEVVAAENALQWFEKIAAEYVGMGMVSAKMQPEVLRALMARYNLTEKGNL